MRTFLLKAVATALTIGATAASAIFVTSHLKNPAAPLKPVVLTAAPAVPATDQPAITSTYAS
jgi:hypothetical protein